jgi:hypothetical protein
MFTLQVMPSHRNQQFVALILTISRLISAVQEISMPFSMVRGVAVTKITTRVSMFVAMAISMT